MIDKTGSFRDNGVQIFLRTVKVRSTEQSGIKRVKIPFDSNIIKYRKHKRESSEKWRYFLFFCYKSCTLSCGDK